MEKEYEIISWRKMHAFFCDECGKALGKSEEYDDGYYAQIGTYSQKIYINSCWYNLNGYYCEECANKKTENIIKALINLGFKKEN